MDGRAGWAAGGWAGTTHGQAGLLGGQTGWANGWALSSRLHLKRCSPDTLEASLSSATWPAKACCDVLWGPYTKRAEKNLEAGGHCAAREAGTGGVALRRCGS